MTHWKKWIWPGILTVVILSALALWLKAPVIEGDLKAKASAALVEQGHAWAEVEMDGRDAVVRGAAPSESGKDQASSITDAVYDIRVVDNQTDLIAAQSPYIFKATRDGDAVELSGFVPDEQARQTLLGAVKETISGSTVTDKLELARGAPEGHAAMTMFGVSQLAGLSKGEFSLEDSAVTLRGASASRDSYNSITQALGGGLPVGATLALGDIEAPKVSPYTWSAKYQEKQVSLDGHVPSEQVRKSITDAVAAALPNVEIVDNQLLASGAPQEFEQSVEFAIAQLPRLKEGDIKLSDKEISFAGVANDPTSFAAATSAIGGALPAGLTLGGSDITPPSVSPFTWKADYDGTKAVLTGFAPNQDSKTQIVSQAKEVLQDIEVEDKMQIAAGASVDLVDQTSFALAQLPNLASGVVELSDNAFKITGVARDTESYGRAIAATSGTLPSNLSLSQATIAPATVSPYTWRAEYDGQTAVLSGHVPDKEARVAINAAIARALGGAILDDKMRVAAGAGSEFLPHASFAVAQLERFSSGSVELSDNALAIRGVARDAQSFNAAETALASQLPPQLTVASQEIMPSTISPYRWSADYDGKMVRLAGFAPNKNARTIIVAAVKTALPEADIDDTMQVAAGEPASFVEATGFAVQQLGRFSRGSVRLSDLDLTVEGTALDSQNYGEANAALKRALPASLVLAEQNITPPTVSPYEWRANHDGQNLILDGFVPDDAARTAISAAAKAALPNASVSDNMQIAAGAPADFVDASSFALAQLSRFSTGRVALSDLALSVEGTALDSASYDGAKAAVSGALPAAMTLASQSILPPTVSPYNWRASYDGQAIVLGGVVPDADTRAAVNAAASAAVPNIPVRDEMQIAAGAPEGYLNAVAFALEQMPRFSAAKVGLSDLNLTIDGTALNPDTYVAAADALSGALPTGLRLADVNIVPASVSPYTWSAKYDGTDVVLAGFVPDGSVRESIVSEVTSKLPGKRVVDTMQIAAGAPDTFSAATTGAISIIPRLSSGTVSLSNLALTVTGVAKSSGNYLAAEGFVAGDLPGGMTLASSAIVPPKAQGDYVWSAQKTKTSIVLAGLSPSREARLSIAKRTSELHPGATVINRMTIQTGAPDGFRPNIDKGLTFLDRLEAGSVNITNQSMSITGQAKSVSEYEAALAETEKPLGDGYVWDQRDIKPAAVSPYTWSAENIGENGVLSGFVPSAAIGVSVLDTAKAVLNKPVDNKQRVAAGQPDGFGDAAAALLSGLSRLDEGRASITGVNAVIQGRADSQEAASKLEGEIVASMPANFKTRALISYPLPAPEPAPEPEVKKPAEPEPVEPKPVEPKPVEVVEPLCNVDFKALFQGDKILFETARAVIRERSYPLLQRIAGGLRECPDALIEVSGHTDSRGRDLYNQQLSEARAEAVIDYMKSIGVNSANLVAKGYGESQPIDSNESPETRINNRRIEFKELQRN